MYKKIIISILISFNIYSYIIPLSGMQEVYNEINKEIKVPKELILNISEINLDENILKDKEDLENNSKELILNKKSIRSNNIIEYSLANLFMNKNAITKFVKKHKIDYKNYYLELVNEVPAAVYGSLDQKEKLSKLYLNQENASPLRAIFNFNGEIIDIYFLEFNNEKYKNTFPTKIKILFKEKELEYQIEIK